MLLRSYAEYRRRSGGRLALCCVEALIVLSLALGSSQGLAAESSRPPAAQVKNQVDSLNLPPRTMELTSEKAARVQVAIKERDFATAHSITTRVLADSKLQNWRFYPFSNFIADITDVYDPSFEERLIDWANQSPNDATPLLIRAQYHCDIGWFTRGRRVAKNTQASHMSTFDDYVRKCYADADRAVHIDERNPYGYYLKLQALRGYGISENMRIVFQDAISKHPEYYLLYDTMLKTLQPKWGGSIDSMHAFVDEHAGQADDSSPLKLLYLSLDRFLLDAASTACYSTHRNDRARLTECVTRLTGKYSTPKLEEQLLVALRLYDHTDTYEFGVALQPILSDMLRTSGGALHSGVILEMAATNMRSDTRLKKDTGDNNYMVDLAVSESWYLKGFYENALTKMQEALRNASATSFPSEEERRIAIGNIYQRMAAGYNKLHRPIDMIAYEMAAVTLGNVTDQEHFICSGYHELKEYEEAIEACNAAIKHSWKASLQARYWRGSAYRALEKTEEALRDFTRVADSEDDFRTSAVIAISMIYFDRKDVHKALDALNKYTYIYDPNTSSKSDIAVSYNNRCYGHMELGELHKALQDCTASLKFGSIPDAFHKQQELIKRLGPTMRVETGDQDTVIPPITETPQFR